MRDSAEKDPKTENEKLNPETSERSDTSGEEPNQKTGSSTETSVSESESPDTESPSVAVTGDSTDNADAGARKPGKAGVILGTLSLALALGLGGYGYYQFRQLNDHLNNENLSLQTQLSENNKAFENQLKAVAEDLNRAQQDRDAQNMLVDRLQSRLTDAIKQVEAGRQTSQSDWWIAESEYLLRLANQRILMEKRPEGALTLLRSADKILHELDDVTLFKLREAIAKEIASLEAVPKLDIEGTYLRLSAMIGQIQNLATLSVEQRPELPEMLNKITPGLIDEAMQQEVKSSLSKALTRLESLVVIQHHDQPIEPLLSPEKGTQLRESLQLLLEQTQLAMLRQQQKIYDQSLERAANLIERYFDLKTASAKALLAAISELKKLTVEPEMPDISGSLTLLQNHMAEMTKLGSEARP